MGYNRGSFLLAFSLAPFNNSNPATEEELQNPFLPEQDLIPRLIARAKGIGFLADQILRANYRRLGSPMKLNWAVTYWCQYKCKTCNIWKLKPQNELTTEEILDFVRCNPNFSWLDLTGGEIFLRQDIAEILEAIARNWQRLVLLHFPTNGYLTERILKTAARIAKLFSFSLIVTVSLDGPEQLNDEIRGIKGGYRRQMETFKALRKIRGIKAVLGMTISRFNLGQSEATLQACLRECPDLDVKDFHVNAAQLSGHYYGNSNISNILAPGKEVAGEIRSLTKRRGVDIAPSSLLEKTYLRRLERFLETGYTPMRCHSLRSSCFIDPWGQVFPCITYSRKLGSLRDTHMKLEPIWISKEARTLQQDIWDFKCPQCWTACEAYHSVLGNLLRPSNRQVFSSPETRGELQNISNW